MHGSPALSDVLVLCTANVARSPLLAARLSVELVRRLGADALTITSGGTDALFGAPAASGSIEVAAGWGIDLHDHRATPLSYLDPDEPALVVTMERRHHRDVVARAPAATARTFTWPELVTTLTERLDPAEGDALPAPTPGDNTARQRLEDTVALAHAHRPRRLPRKRAEVPDPIRGGQDVYDALGERFDREVTAVAGWLFGPGPATR